MLKAMKLKHSRLSETQTKKLLEFFMAGATARMAAELVGVNRNTAIGFYDKLRQIIAFNLEQESPSPFIIMVSAWRKALQEPEKLLI